MPQSENATPTAPASVLVVDDVPDNIDVMVGVLRANYRIRAATSGATALRIAFSDKPPDLILLDIMMPEMDGLEVCRRLQANPATAQIPVIFLTAMGEVQDMVAGLEMGAVDYVTKPADPAVLRARVKTHIELKQAREQLQRQLALVEENARLREDVERITRHDLKNPLGLILGYAELLAQDPTLGADQRESARIMEQSAYAMLDMINRSLDLYRMETGSYRLDPKPVDLVRVANRSIEDTRRLAGQLGVELELSAPGTGCPALGDELLCHSMLGNLLRNAVEASPPRRPCRGHPEQRSGGTHTGMERGRNPLRDPRHLLRQVRDGGQSSGYRSGDLLGPAGRADPGWEHRLRYRHGGHPGDGQAAAWRGLTHPHPV